MRDQITRTFETEQPSFRELSLDETEMVGGGFSWGGFFRGAEHLARDIDKGMVAGAITGGVAGAIAGEGAGAAPGAVAGSLVGGVSGVLNFLNI